MIVRLQYYFTLWEFFPSALADGFLLEFEWLQVSTSLQDSSHYFFSHKCHLMVLYLSSSDCKSLQISRTLLSILADLSNAMVRMVSILPLISNSSSLSFKLLGTVPSAPITIGITVTLIFHSYFSLLLLLLLLLVYWLLLLLFLFFHTFSAVSLMFPFRQLLSRPRLAFFLFISGVVFFCRGGLILWLYFFICPFCSFLFFYFNNPFPFPKSTSPIFFLP